MQHNPSQPQGMRLLRELQLKGKHIFTVEDAANVAKEYDIPRRQLNKALSALTKDGWLTRLRR